MRERDRLGPLPASRRIGLVVPVVLSMVDSLAIVSIVAEGRRCGPECAFALSALAALLIGPLAVVGVGDAERYPSPGATALACVVVIFAVFGWWWIVTNRLAGQARDSMLHFFGLYVVVAIVMCIKNALLLAISDGPLVWPAVVVEVVLAVVGMAAVR